MTATTFSSTIQMILAPVVMVSACAGVLIGMLARYSAINDRLRVMTRERLDLLRGPTADALAQERLHEIDTQAPELLRRHKLVRDAVLATYCAVGVFIVDMFVIAAASAIGSAGAVAALAVFLVGTALMLVAAVIIVLEVRVSHVAMHYECHRVLNLGP